jgi:hypothetical protein
MRNTLVIPSDRYVGRRYTVVLEDGLAVACNCPAGKRGNRCKHRARAEARVVFTAVWRRLLGQATRDHKRARHEALSAKYYGLLQTEGRDVAMSEVILMGHPNGHPCQEGLLANHARLQKGRLARERSRLRKLAGN